MNECNVTDHIKIAHGVGDGLMHDKDSIFYSLAQKLIDVIIKFFHYSIFYSLLNLFCKLQYIYLRWI